MIFKGSNKKAERNSESNRMTIGGNVSSTELNKDKRESIENVFEPFSKPKVALRASIAG